MRERHAVDELGGDEAQAASLAGVVDGEDVRVIERRDAPGLPLEARDPLLGGGGCWRSQDLERQLAAEAHVLGQEDLAHAAGAERGEDAVVGQHIARCEGPVHRRHTGGSTAIVQTAADDRIVG